MSNWYQKRSIEVVEALESSEDIGLNSSEIEHRLEKYGSNELVEQGQKGAWQIFAEQFTGVLVIILLVAAILSAVLGDYEDAIAIAAIVILNGFLGFRQEYRAEQAMSALKRMATPLVRVRKDGQVDEVNATSLVPGDIVLLEAGNLVPADGRLLASASLKVQEAALTGEAESIEKEADTVFETELPLGDRFNMVYRGTTVTYGRGTAVVTETGMSTELGHVASLIQSVGRDPTPLQKRLDRVGRTLGVLALVVAAVVFVAGVLRGEDLRVMLLTAVGLAVASVPEGLPTVVTISLSLGAERMLKRNALVRKLPAVETLGSVTVICSDKTGTLTENQMTVTMLDIAGQQIDLSERLDRKRVVLGELEPAAVELTKQPAISLLLVGSALCNDAVLEPEPDRPNTYRALGDPTETALVVAAAKVGLFESQLDRVFPRLAEVPFDSERKRMTTLHACPKTETGIPEGLNSAWILTRVYGVPESIAFCKGGINSLLAVSNQVWVNDHVEPLTPGVRSRIQTAHDQLAQKGLRVLMVGLSPWEQVPSNFQPNTLENDFILVGMVGMLDPARPEVKKAVQTCQEAGIRVVMITGDHPLTAHHIASELGISQTQEQVQTHHQAQHLLTGQELKQLSDEALGKTAETVDVYARVSPEDKLNIIQALQAQGHIVAMTGDGVNDAPALKKADIGVAMGITGTDVAKEAADIVLQDDNFATIVAAVQEGRTIYDNIRKFIRYLLSGNVGEIWTMGMSLFLVMPIPLLPLQILWINLVSDGLPALALGLEPAEQDVMSRAPRRPNENLFGRGTGQDIFLIGVLIGSASLIAGYGSWQAGDPAWQTMIFTTLTLGQIVLALTARFEQLSCFSVNPFTNPALIGAAIVTTGLQLLLIYVPWLQGIFETVPLSKAQLGYCLLLSTTGFWGFEIKKWFVRRSLARQ